jgi:hypothetical protein
MRSAVSNDPGDLPRWLADRRRGWARAAQVIVVVAIAAQVWDVVGDVVAAQVPEGADRGGFAGAPWAPLALLYLSAAAIGVEAAVRGVRAELARGPSIRNLTPGGWACFAALAWIVAVPAYALAIRRRERPNARRVATAEERLGRGDALAILVVASMGLGCACVAAVSALDTLR